MSITEDLIDGRECRYDLTADQVEEFTSRLVGRHRAAIDLAIADGRRLVSIALEPFDELAALARTVEQQGLSRLADGHSPSEMRHQYGPFEDQSLFFVALNTTSLEAVAAMRVVVGSAGVGPLVKSIDDTLRHPEFIGQTHPTPNATSNIVDLREHTAADSGQLLLSHRRGRHVVEDRHGMKPGRLILDIATVVNIRAGLGSASSWSIVSTAAVLRCARELDADYCVSFVVTDVMDALIRLLRMPWVALAGDQPVRYLESDPFLSQPAFFELKAFDSDVRAEYDRHVAGEPASFGSAFRRLAILSYDADAEATFIR